MRQIESIGVARDYDTCGAPTFRREEVNDNADKLSDRLTHQETVRHADYKSSTLR